MIIVDLNKKSRLGKTRSEQAINMEKEGWGLAGMDEGQLDKCKFLEKSGRKFHRATDIDEVR